MLIIAKKAFRFKLRDKDTKKVIQTAEVRPQVITKVPDWVRNDDLFKLAVKDESITFVESAKNQQPNADEELQALRARAGELQIPRAGQLGRERLIAAITEAEEAAAKIEAEERAKAEAEAKAKAEAQNQ